MYGVSFKRVHNPREGIYFALLLLYGCASTEKDLPVPYAVTFHVAADVNRDSQNRPAPVALQTFQLKSDNNFRKADYFSLQNKPEDALGPELAGTDRIVLRPGESRTLHYTGGETVRSLGIVAGYRTLEKRRWKITVALPQPASTNLFKFWQGKPSEAHFVIVVQGDGLVATPASGDAR
ncbi:type VI secretion system lipoprotein TssJ [Paraburkholderia sp. CNPSo 3281]|uniref:type VI secretion system lipoprotein TssJ n=1 Tax=Paraburkholderia sp. CNPSo 3281 TaxID=2940933 RepID=UPI0020B78525|nr:type VI secretion system lipoprotein TssJ [Paraburkholderia sp. CNPSo 3281]MCP3720279.1 type VI secretion system lipoprotein TssJ [Paraburkholderia sp. CNPSo 3281]